MCVQQEGEHLISSTNDLLDSVIAEISAQGLALTSGPPTPTGNVSVIKGKVPVAQDDYLINLLANGVLWCSYSDKHLGESMHWATGRYPAPRQKKNTYYIDITGVAPGNRLQGKGLVDYLDWRELITLSPGGKPDQVGFNKGADSQVFDVNVLPGTVIDKPAWLQNYDMTQLTLKFELIEPAYN
jgi:hypothetical protein